MRPTQDVPGSRITASVQLRTVMQRPGKGIACYARGYHLAAGVPLSHQNCMECSAARSSPGAHAPYQGPPLTATWYYITNV